jgi:hypothetical protein
MVWKPQQTQPSTHQAKSKVKQKENENTHRGICGYMAKLQIWAYALLSLLELLKHNPKLKIVHKNTTQHLWDQGKSNQKERKWILQVTCDKGHMWQF